MIVLGHILGIPVEETLLSFVPVGAVGVGAVVFVAREHLRRLRRRPPAHWAQQGSRRLSDGKSGGAGSRRRSGQRKEDL